jgi:protein TonB
MRRLFVLSLAVAVMPVWAQTPQELPSAPAPTQAVLDRPVHVGGSVKAPVLVSSAEPELTEEARRKHLSGNVQVYLWVDEHGNPTHVRVTRGVGLGLDEKAVEAVRKYKFKPATQDGKPVTVELYVDVNFLQF